MSTKKRFLLAIIIAVGLFLRLYGLNWDQGFHLHPDERFLTMVSTDISFPKSIGEYFDRHTSSLNPENNNHAFYVYGLAPITINKFIGELLLNNTYDTLHLQGRLLSAIADASIIVILFAIVQMLEKKCKLPSELKYYTAGFYSIAVLPIQLSHFFTVDTFMHFFGWLSIYFAVRSAVIRWQNSFSYVVLSAVFLGLALASKISAVFYIPPIFIGLSFFGYHMLSHSKKVLYLLGLMFSWGVVLYVSLRFASPYYFNSANFFDVTPSQQFLHNLSVLKSFENPNGYFPPAVQWLRAPWYLVPVNIIFFGLGIIYAILAVVGGYRLILSSKIWKAVLLWTVVILVYQSVQFAKTMRYLIVLYPVFALCAGYGLWYTFKLTHTIPTLFRKIIRVIIVVGIVVWPMAFMSIYTTSHSRVAASVWMFDAIASGSTIAWEYWDDPLPLLVPNPKNKQFKSEQIGIFDPDTAEKWNGIQKQLLKSDYYVMSSNRGWGSIPTVPERYPLATDFYKDMFDNKRGFTLEKEFTSYPSLRYLGIPIDFPDDWAEEAFTVYDHPKVLIFKRNMR